MGMSPAQKAGIHDHILDSAQKLTNLIDFLSAQHTEARAEKTLSSGPASAKQINGGKPSESDPIFSSFSRNK